MADFWRYKRNGVSGVTRNSHPPVLRRREGASKDAPVRSHGVDSLNRLRDAALPRSDLSHEVCGCIRSEAPTLGITVTR